MGVLNKRASHIESLLLSAHDTYLFPAPIRNIDDQLPLPLHVTHFAWMIPIR